MADDQTFVTAAQKPTSANAEVFEICTRISWDLRSAEQSISILAATEHRVLDFANLNLGSFFEVIVENAVLSASILTCRSIEQEGDKYPLYSLHGLAKYLDKHASSIIIANKELIIDNIAPNAEVTSACDIVKLLSNHILQSIIEIQNKHHPLHTAYERSKKFRDKRTGHNERYRPIIGISSSDWLQLIDFARSLLLLVSAGVLGSKIGDWEEEKVQEAANQLSSFLDVALSKK